MEWRTEEEEEEEEGGQEDTCHGGRHLKACRSG